MEQITTSLKNLLCAECGQLAVNLDQKTNQLKCSNCNNITNIEIYQKSIQLLYQEIIVQSLKHVIGQHAGVITSFLGKNYIVYFDKNNEINIAELEQAEIQNSQIGSVVKIINEQGDNLTYQQVKK